MNGLYEMAHLPHTICPSFEKASKIFVKGSSTKTLADDTDFLKRRVKHDAAFEKGETCPVCHHGGGRFGK